MRRQTRWDHRPPDTVDPPDDWVNGSWTVDCVCGVNFDDGEEMVNCDECGVWVHTRCSRYVKSEKLFACDKCKSNKNNKDYDNNDRIEEEEAETEVAQLLIDLPSKALRRSLGNPIPSHGFRRRPMEERVHVQGIPGGDVGIFGGAGLSSVFGPELWKCTGYVPKKFNFQYNEFGCWNDGNENRANVGDVNAEVLSLSKNKAVVDVDSASLGTGTETQVQETKKKGEGDDLDVRSMQHNRIKKKDRSSVHQTMIHYGKRKKEDSETTKYVSGKKKARVVHVEGEDSKKRSPRTSRSAATPSGDSKQPEFHGSGGFKVDENVTESGKNKKLKGNLHDEPSLKVDDPKNTLAFSGQTPKTSSCVASTHKISVQAGPEDGCDEITASLQNSSKISDSLRLLRDHNESGSLPAKAEDVVSFDNVNHRGVVSISDQVKTDHPVQSAETVAPQVIDSQNDRDSTGPGSLPQHHDHVITKVECADSLQSIDHKVEDADREIDNAEGAPSAPVLFQFNSQLFGSDSSQMAMERSSALKQVTHGEEPSESCDTTLISSEQLSQRKLMVSFGKSSSTTLLSKCLTSDSRRSLDSQNFNGSIKHNVVSEHKSSKKDNSSAGFVMDRERYGKPKKVAKELRKSSISSVKTSNLSKIPVSSISTKSLSETKESTGISSAKRSLVQNVSDNPMSGESASSLQPENISCVDNKATTSGLMQRTEPVKSSKVNHTPQMYHSTASNTPATLSDEELALLLHHELNSSPRVPRLPRMRHAGSLPQLASPTGATMLTKRSSFSSVGKDQGLVFKRKGKSIANEGTKNSHKLQDEYKNVKKSPLLPVQRTNDSTRTVDSVTKKEVDYGSAAGVKSVDKSILRATTLTGGSASSAAIDAREQNVSSTCKSPHNASDDDTGTDARPIHRTLPELLSEIMNKRMTYEELCNAVLPHWPYLRKHNGERYAYSSHSQAVLDCLRNRSEWARLVDRGPKTNAGRKRRRSDAEAPSFESEGNDGNTKNAKGVVRKNIESQKDQFPKGKRKARKCRRRLSLQGRGLKNMVLRRGRKQKEADDVNYDEDICSLSSSSSGEESTSDEDSGGTSSASGQSEASASSE